MPLKGRGARARLLYASLIRVEELPLYHVCPGEAAARLVAAGSPWECRVCRWSDAVSTVGLVVREAPLGEVLSRFRLAEPRVLMLDGPEPLHALGDAALELPRLAWELLPSVEATAVYTMGLVGAEMLRRAAEAGFHAVVFEYTAPLERPPAMERVVEALEEAYRVFEVVEIVVHHDGSREATVALSSLATRYPDAAVHVYAREGAEDKAYEAVAKLRDKGLVNVYLHPEESYTLTDTLCPRCGAVLVERKPWGVRVHAKPRGRRATCPSCGAEARMIVCREQRRRPRALHREVVVW